MLNLGFRNFKPIFFRKRFSLVAAFFLRYGYLFEFILAFKMFN